MQFSGGCVEAVAYKRLVCAPRRFKLDGCRANFFASFDPLGGPFSLVCMPRESGEGQQWPRRCLGLSFCSQFVGVRARRFEFDSRDMNFLAGFHFLCCRCWLVCAGLQTACNHALDLNRNRCQTLNHYDNHGWHNFHYEFRTFGKTRCLTGANVNFVIIEICFYAEAL